VIMCVYCYCPACREEKTYDGRRVCADCGGKLKIEYDEWRSVPPQASDLPHTRMRYDD